MLWAGKNYKRQVQVDVTSEQAIQITDLLEYGIISSDRFKQQARIKKNEKRTISRIEILFKPGWGFVGMTTWKCGLDEKKEVVDIPSSIAISQTFRCPLTIQKSILDHFKAPKDEVNFMISFAIEHLHWPEIWTNIFKNLHKMSIETLNRLMEVSLRDQDYKGAALLRDEFQKRNKAKNIQKNKKFI